MQVQRNSQGLNLNDEKKKAAAKARRQKAWVKKKKRALREKYASIFAAKKGSTSLDNNALSGSKTQKLSNIPTVPYIRADFLDCSKDDWRPRYRITDTATKTTFESHMQCRSWRCIHCARSIAHTNNLRISKALKKDGRNFFYGVLTLNSTARQASLETAYKNLVIQFKALKIRYFRKFKENFKYVVSIEQHNNDPYPHMNFVVTSDHLHGLSEQQVVDFVESWLKPTLGTLEFGNADKTFKISRVLEVDKVSNYMSKSGLNQEKIEKVRAHLIRKKRTLVDLYDPNEGVHVKDLSPLPLDVSLLSQLPISAPPRFRRLRATVKFLEPAKNFKRPRHPDHKYEALPSVQMQKALDKAKKTSHSTAA